MAVLDRIKLVNPPAEQIDKGADGLLRLDDGLASEPAADVRLASGMLESSNVNPVSAMVQMIELSRQYEMHVRMMSTAEELDTASTQLMRLE